MANWRQADLEQGNGGTSAVVAAMAGAGREDAKPDHIGRIDDVKLDFVSVRPLTAKTWFESHRKRQ
jgi:hypothetical protein